MPTSLTRGEQAMRAGKKLREIRTKRGWTARDIEQKTRDIFGEGREINETQNGRIENGGM